MIAKPHTCVRSDRNTEHCPHPTATKTARSRPVSIGGGSADELAKLADLHPSGKLTDDEYAQAKGRVIAG